MNRQLLVRFVVYSPALVLLALLVAGWGSPVLDEHGFRQTQTLLSSYWMTRGESWWMYSTPVLGYPWAVPFEFPLYQWAVALLAMLPVGLSIDDAGRLVSAAAMVACVWPLRQILRGVGGPERLLDLATVLFLLSPLHLFWGRAAMIESTALLLSMLFVVAIQRLVDRVTLVRCLAALALAVLATLVKVTTFFAFALLAGAIVGVALAKKWRARDVAGAVRLALAAAVPILIALLTLVAWLEAGDRMKLGSVLAEFGTSGNLSQWNINQQPLAKFDEFWRAVVLGRMLPDILGYAAWMAPLALLLLAPGKRRWLAWLAACLALFLVPMLVFTGLHFIHNYYQMANATFLLVALAVILHGVSERWRVSATTALATVAAAGMLLQFHGHYWQLIRNIDPEQRSLVLASVLREYTAPEDVVVTMGLGWSSEVPYYAKRRAVMLLQDDFQAFVPPTLRAPGKGDQMLRLGAVVRCGEQRADISSLTPMICGAKREIEAAGCSIVVREDPGPSSDTEADCERGIAREARLRLGPQPAGALVLGPFSQEWLHYRAMDQCNIEFVGEGSTSADAFTRGQSMTVAGWFLSPPLMSRPAKPMLRLRSESLGRSWYAALDRTIHRPDLAASFGPAAVQGGFRTNVSLENLPPGRYEMMLVDLNPLSPGQCRQLGKSIIVR